MTARKINMAASVRQRLLNRAREQREDFGLLLTRFGTERLLYRLGESEYGAAFILKGAMLFPSGAWTSTGRRAMPICSGSARAPKRIW